MISISSLNLLIPGNALDAKIAVEPGESIQSAIDQASPGDVIEVKSGTYSESIEVNKRLALRGVDTGRGAPIIESAAIIADHSEFSGFKVSNRVWFGIIVNSNNSSITNNEVEACIGGIFLKSVHGNLVARNNVKVVCESWYGLLSGSFSLGGGDGIQLNYSYDNTIKDNTVTNGFIGIYLDTSKNNLVVGNNASDSSNGIGLFSATGNTIRDNTIRNNSDDGIGLVKFSDNNTITGNIVEDNGDFGIWLKDSSHNNIYLNVFRNDKNAQSMDYHSQGSSSLWQSPEPVAYFEGNKSIKGYAGNYWSGYQGKDQNGDDIGDKPYTFDGGQDDYPLMRPRMG